MSLSDNSSIVVGLWENMQTAAFGSLEPNGHPHVSLVTVTPQDNGTTLLLLSDLARHTTNIKRDDRASLLVEANQFQTVAQSDNIDPLANERITIHGSVKVLPLDQQQNYKIEFVKHHPTAEQYINFADFNLYQFSASEIHLVGGFGRIETFSTGILEK